MPYTAIQQLDLIKENKIKIINKINTLLGKDSGLTWDSSWNDFLNAIKVIKTLLPEENYEIIDEIEKFLANQSIGEITVNSEEIIPYAFYGKTSITKLIGPNVKTVGMDAFRGTRLSSVELPIAETIKSRAFYGSIISNLDLPKVTTIESEGFSNNSSLVSINIPKLTRINSYSFYNCYNLSSVHIPSITYIESYGFYGTQIKLKEIPVENLTNIGSYGFCNCSKLGSDTEKIEILPKNSLTIGSYCFQYSAINKDVFIGANVAIINNYAFRDCGSNTKFWCEATSKPSDWSTNWNYSNYPVNWGCIEKEYTFVKNNGEDNLIITKRYITNDDFPVIEKEGYQLDSWYLDEDFVKEVSTPYYSKVGSTEPTTFYARWTRGFNLKAINIEDNFAETDLGIYYFNNISEFKDSLGLLNCVGYYEHYANQTFENVISDLETIEGFLPTIYIKATNATVVTEVKDFNYTGSVTETTLLPGQHTLECWGAQGGNNSSNTKEGGHGGYSTGVLTLTENTLINVLVGGAGTNGYNGSHLVPGGFNGGGTGYTYNSGTCGGGGGATDIRLFQDSLYSRVIVAGGGGGAAGNSYTSSSYFGYQFGYGGGETAAGYTNYTITNGQASGASMAGPGNAPYTNGNSPKSGTFGFGGTWTSYPNNYSAAGGGGGWYGGHSGIYDGYAGGGSGFVYTKENAQYYPEDCLLNSSYYLTDANILAGNAEFLSPDGTIEQGHTGNGHIRITSVIRRAHESAFKGCTIILKGVINNELINLDTLLLMHNIPKNTLENKFGIYVNSTSEWYFDEECTIPVGNIIEINTDNAELTLYSQVIEIVELNFEYTGDVQTVTLTPATYKLECWGAQGGDNLLRNYTGGRGGYSSGQLTLDSATDLFIYVGGAGKNAIRQSSYRTLGGFNGGGDGMSEGTSWDSVSGGGASDIRLMQDNLYSRIIVAGGGGAAGGGDNAASNNYGGFGGGTTSGSAFDVGSASQTQGGKSETQYSTRHLPYGQFGQGDGSSQSNQNLVVTGGGGGWYGGGAGVLYGASGGSGYVFTAKTVLDYPSGCMLDSRYYLTEAETIAGNQEFLAPDGAVETGHAGNGYVRITKIG